MSENPSSGGRGRHLTVLVASSERGLYGGETQALLLAEGLQARGHRVVLLARHDGALLPRAVAAGIEARPWRSRHGIRGLLSTRLLLRRFRPDVLHCNDARALTGAGGVSVGLSLGARVASRRVPFPVRSPFAYRKLADAVICVSDHVRDSCLRSGLPAPLLHVVHDGVDADLFHAADRRRGRAAMGTPEGDTVVLTVASLTEDKGHEVLLQAMEPLLGARPRARLVLAGEGPLRARLEARIAGSDWGDRIHLLGYRHDVPDLLQAADVFVLPSLREGLGTALLEAMTAQVPCVASALAGPTEALGSTDGRAASGWLVPPGDAEALSRAIREAVDRPEEAALRARRAHARAVSRFTADRMVEGTLAVYRKVLTGG